MFNRLKVAIRYLFTGKPKPPIAEVSVSDASLLTIEEIEAIHREARYRRIVEWLMSEGKTR